MLVPILLVLGGPVTLLLRALPPAGSGAPPGPREWVLAAVHAPIARVLTQPLVALALFVGSFYVLYFSGLFDVALEQHWAHLAMNAHFLLVTINRALPILGIDDFWQRAVVGVLILGSIVLDRVLAVRQSRRLIAQREVDR